MNRERTKRLGPMGIAELFDRHRITHWRNAQLQILQKIIPTFRPRSYSLNDRAKQRRGTRTRPLLWFIRLKNARGSPTPRNDLRLRALQSDEPNKR